MVHHNINRISTYFDSSSTVTKTEECIGECFTLLRTTLGWPSFSSCDPNHCAPKCNQLHSAQPKLHENPCPFFHLFDEWRGAPAFSIARGRGNPWVSRIRGDFWGVGRLVFWSTTNSWGGTAFSVTPECTKEWRDGLATAHFSPCPVWIWFQLDEQIFLMTRSPTSCECLIEVGLFLSLWKDHV